MPQETTEKMNSRMALGAMEGAGAGGGGGAAAGSHDGLFLLEVFFFLQNFYSCFPELVVVMQESNLQKEVSGYQPSRSILVPF